MTVAPMADTTAVSSVAYLVASTVYHLAALKVAAMVYYSDDLMAVSTVAWKAGSSALKSNNNLVDQMAVTKVDQMVELWVAMMVHPMADLMEYY